MLLNHQFPDADTRQQMGFITNQIPFYDTNPTEDNTLECKFALTKQYTVIPTETGASKLHSASNVLPSAIETLSKNSDMYVSAKGVTTKILNEGLFCSLRLDDSSHLVICFNDSIIVFCLELQFDARLAQVRSFLI